MANYPDLKLYVDGEWRRADGQPVINPSDESVHCAARDTRGPGRRARCGGTGLQGLVSHVAGERAETILEAESWFGATDVLVDAWEEPAPAIGAGYATT